MKKLLLLLLLLASTKVSAEYPDSLTFAVLGNSISTYYDYIPSGYAVYYTESREREFGIQVGDQWWMQLSRLSGLTYLANASWSGSRVAYDSSTLGKINPFMSNGRVKALSRAGVPDIVFVLGGTNDWAHSANIPLGQYKTSNFNDSLSFRGAYQRLLWKLTTWYPQTKVVCLSILPRGESATQQNAAGWTQADGNASIKHIAEQFGQYYIDCTTIPFSSNWSLYMVPGNLHPSAAGFTIMAQHIYNQMLSQGIITSDLKRSAEVEEAERLLDLSFTADGIINQGTYDSRVGKRGGAITVYDAERDIYYGCTKAKKTDYFYATYDEDTPLANAFNGNVTWEMLVRLDGLADHNNEISRTCILGNEENGGWAFYNSDLASSFCYQNVSGVKSTMKSISGDSILIAGKFYHLVVTMDRTSHIMRYFINGKLACTGTRAGSDMKMPQCGSSKGHKNMWICLGGDATGGVYSSSTLGAENSSACTFVFARIYDGALSQNAAIGLYNDNVKRFTEPKTLQGSELLLDMQLTPDSIINFAPSFRNKPVVMMGDIPVNYNVNVNQYEAQFNGVRSQFFKYFLGDNPSIMNQLADAYSVEVFCKTSSALPSTNIRVLGCGNGYGFGLQMESKGNIGYCTTTLGNKSDGTYVKTQWSWAGAGSLTVDYTHYVIVYDRKNYKSQFYINGALAYTRWLTFKECSIFEWAPSEWLAIGGDASGTYDKTSSTVNYPFQGDVALVRIYSKALNQTEVQSLQDILSVQEQSYKVGASGYVAVCLPYVYQVPEGCTAFIVSEIVSPSVKLRPIAQAGELVPYGTPVIIKGTAKSSIMLTALNKSEVDAKYLLPLSQENLLVGTYPGKTLATNEGYYLKPAVTSKCIYRATSDVTLPAFSCYLPSDEKRSYYKLEEEATTDISRLTGDMSSMNEEAIYDLSGRKVGNDKMKSGIYIKSGKKISVK